MLCECRKVGREMKIAYSLKFARRNGIFVVIMQSMYLDRFMLQFG